VKLLDTSVAIDHLRGVEPAVELLTQIIEADEPILASEIVRFELLAGVREREVDALELFFSALSWVPVGQDVARTAAALARDHRRSHSGIDDADYLIAATTLLLDAELLTTNVRHFPMLKDLRTPY
jgi:predicted nucleic acid-binding protein